MGQQDIYDLLKKYKDKWFDAREIAGVLNLSITSVVSNLKRLRKPGFIMFKLAKKAVSEVCEKHVYMYKYKED